MLPAKNHQAFKVIFSGMLYGTLGFFGMSLLASGMSVFTMLFWRFLIAGILIIVFFKKNAALKSLLQKDLAIGSLAYGVSAAFYFLASVDIGSGLAMVLFFTYPAMVILFAWAWEKRAIFLATIFSLASIFLGMVLLWDGNAAIKISGFGWALGSAFLYAVFIIANASNKKSSDPLTATVCLSFSSALLFFILSLLRNEFTIPNSFAQWSNILAIAILATAMPAYLLLDGLQGIEKGKAAILTALEPITTVILGILFLHEAITLRQLTGVIVVLLGVIFIQFEKGNNHGV
mgnify:CR=1 FL=1